MIWDLYGRSQEALAHSRFNSALRRWDYAMVHLEELERTLHLTNDTFGKYPFSERLFLRFKINADQIAAYNDNVDRVGANSTACVANLHAIADLFAQGIAYALGMDATDKSQFPRQPVNAHAILDRLSQSEETRRLADLLEELIKNDDFAYLADLNNQSKHNNLVRAGLMMDAREQRQPPYWSAFEAFERRDRTHDQKDALETLESEMDRQMALIIKAGNALNEILTTRTTNA
jgi:hypothetical protein